MRSDLSPYFKGLEKLMNDHHFSPYISMMPLHQTQLTFDAEFVYVQNNK